MRDLINKITPGDVITVSAQPSRGDVMLNNLEPSDQTGVVMDIEQDVPIPSWSLGGVRVTFTDGRRVLLKANSLCVWHGLTPAPGSVEDDDTVISPSPLVEKESVQ